MDDAGLADRVRARLGDADGAAFLRRLEAVRPDAAQALGRLYGHRTDLPEFLSILVDDVLEQAAARGPTLRALDRRREADPGWFQDPGVIGYVCYVDRFAGTVAGVRERLDYLTELGVTYLHLMPVLEPRAGANDGGYAVRDYDAVDPRIGSMADLVGLAGDLHARGISLCVDMVLNHTAREHEWARRAAAGDPFYRNFYLIFPDRTEPDRFERTLPDIFPDLAPGNFTYDHEVDGWVWTTFYDYQWDLDYANPDVFRAVLGTMLRLANRGVDVLRLDAAPFLWKRLGTDCQNQPEAHLVLQAFRALTRLAAPGLLLKAEAMVAPDILAAYLGAHEQYRPECDLAYDNQLMVMLWSSVATGDARLAAQALTRRPAAPAPTSWVTYARCHDDIGWAVSDIDAAAVGLDGTAHRRWLSEFYAGRVPGSFARGAVFQDNPAGASPISGMLASLCGIEAAADDVQRELALRRLESLYSVVFSFGGIPLVYMGDEIALRNDPDWAADPDHRADNRWMHRPPMDWAAAARRHDAHTVAGRAHAALRGLAAARARQPALAGTDSGHLLPGLPRQVLAYTRSAAGAFVAAVNLDVRPILLDTASLGTAGAVVVHATAGCAPVGRDGIEVPGCGFVWLTTAGAGR